MDWLRERFEANMERHPGVSWQQVEKWLKDHPEAKESLDWMEESGGMPDVVRLSDNVIGFVDCSEEVPGGRRSLCYDEKARLARKKNAPSDSAVALAQRHGLSLLTEEEYFQLQEVSSFDQKTSTWLLTPEELREKGGALFGKKRYGRVFIYYNGADSYYQARGFRCILKIS
ncbi:MAG: DUF4256 domain-containing protein [Lactimicrobium sp.]|jgi:hypothetical protein|uniref:DUF4256 domain-containing protein n=1 Tax=Lactimicrobium sp. TaxID=2563780 RepID=UPI002F35C595